MSGLCAVVHWSEAPVAAEVLERMLERGAHRGTEGGMCHRAGSVGMAYTALRIAEAAREDTQPLLDSSGNLLLVADVRLDDRRELIDGLELDENGRQPTDSELVLAAYERWGVAAPTHLYGDFAFAIWDAGKRRLLCARDTAGVKPLHYSSTPDFVCVASEARQVLEHPAVRDDLDELSIGRFMVGLLEDDERTVFRQVKRLRPGHRLVVEAGRAREERYWNPAEVPRLVYSDAGEYAAALAELVERAVSSRLETRRGTPVGIHLSGGLDSATVASVAQGLGTRRLIAYSHTFPSGADCDESAYITELADSIGLQVVFRDAEADWLLRDETAFAADDESPFLGFESTIRADFQELSAAGGRVLLTGHGGDSLLTGSPLVYADRMRRFEWWSLARDLRRHARQPQATLRHLLFNYVATPLLPERAVVALRQLARRPLPTRPPDWVDPRFAARCGLQADLRRAYRPHRHGRTARQVVRSWATDLASIGWALYWYDRLGARYGVEVRHPLLDRRILEFVLAVPAGELYASGTAKHLLRQAIAGRVPQAIRQRRDKADFRTYLADSLGGAGRDRVRALLLGETALAEMGFIEPRRYEKIVQQFLSKPAVDITPVIWFTLSLELWLRRHGGRWAAGQSMAA